ncbi:hypothetical protein M422DRAFT_777816 [Sphaerobolus stellatus SS14]|nr:hypothetical protein M422DRAFT_777816 [Sphaerobolus stellatus SS14]
MSIAPFDLIAPRHCLSMSRSEELPVEIFQEIVAMGLPTIEPLTCIDVIREQGETRQRTLTTYLLVCRRWKDMIEGYPHAWTTLWLTGQLLRDVRRMKCILARSGTLPLDVYGASVGYSSRFDIDTSFNEVLLHTSRFRVFVDIKSYLRIFHANVHQPLTLEVLRFTEGSMNCPPDAVIHAPNLRVFQLFVSDYVEPKISPATARSLQRLLVVGGSTWSVKGDFVSAFIGACSCLQTLIWDAPAFEDGQNGDPVALPSITHMQLYEHHTWNVPMWICSHLTLTSLTHLTYVGVPYLYSILSMAELMPCAATLRVLRVSRVIFQGSVHWVETYPNLAMLHLRDSYPDEDFMLTLQRNCREEPEKKLLPNLRRLEFYNCRNCPRNLEKLLEEQTAYSLGCSPDERLKVFISCQPSEMDSLERLQTVYGDCLELCIHDYSTIQEKYYWDD